jgi:hypothetical protein
MTTKLKTSQMTHLASGGNAVGLDTLLDTKVNVLSFGAVGDGVTNDSPAFQAAVNSVPSGQGVTLIVPRTTAPSNYLLNTNIVENGRTVTALVEEGATVTGTIYVSRVEESRGNLKKIVTQGGHDDNNNLGEYVVHVNNGTKAGYGELRIYDCYLGEATNENGGDIGFSHRAIFRNLQSTAGFGQWDITVTPEEDDPAGPDWAVIDREINVVYRGPDYGWQNRPGATRHWSGGVAIIPDIGTPWGSIGGNILYGIHLAKCSETNSRTPAYNPRMYNVILIRDAAAPGGRALYVEGSSSANPTDWAYTPFEILGKWTTGIDATDASFGDNRFVQLADEHRVTWVHADGVSHIRGTAAKDVRIGNDTGAALIINTSVANAVNIPFFVPGASGSPSTLGQNGTSPMLLQGSSTGGIQLGSTGGKVGFYQETPVVKPTVSGAKDGNAALTSLLTALSQLGLITDTTT